MVPLAYTSEMSLPTLYTVTQWNTQALLMKQYIAYPFYQSGFTRFKYVLTA